MNQHQAEGFFPGLQAVRAMRPRAGEGAPMDPWRALTQRVSVTVTMSVTILTPIFANAVVFGWLPLKVSLEIILCAALFILLVGGALASVNLRRVVLRTNRPSA